MTNSVATVAGVAWLTLIALAIRATMHRRLGESGGEGQRETARAAAGVLGVTILALAACVAVMLGLVIWLLDLGADIWR